MKQPLSRNSLFFLFLHCVPGVHLVSAQLLKVPYVSISPTNGPLWIAKETQSFHKA